MAKVNKLGVLPTAILGLLGLTILVVGLPKFFAFGVDSDLSKYQKLLKEAKMDGVGKEIMLKDLEEVRLSVGKKNNFGFTYWVDGDKLILEILEDGVVDSNEKVILDKRILQMKKTQGLKTVTQEANTAEKDEKKG